MAGKKTFRCKVVTPTAAVLDDDVTYASVPGWDGLFGVLPGRAAMLGRLGAGELRLDFPDTAKYEGGTRSYYLGGGFVRMEGDHLTILAEKAIPAEEIQLPEAEAELRAAQARAVEGQTATDRALDLEAKQAAVMQARAKVALAKAQKFI